jgi:biopolymer transport protein ExbD
MKLERNLSFNPAWLGVVPLVNVVFLVLLFFALSSSYVLQPGIAIHLPTSPFTVHPQRDPQIVTIVASPTAAVYFHDERLTLDEFSQRLTAIKGKNRTLIIRADRGIPYDTVMAVMNAGFLNGCSVVLATAEQPYSTANDAR